MGTGLRAVLYMWSCCLTPQCLWVSDSATLLLQMFLFEAYTSSYMILTVGSYQLPYTIWTLAISDFTSYVWMLVGFVGGVTCSRMRSEEDGKRGTAMTPFL